MNGNHDRRRLRRLALEEAIGSSRSAAASFVGWARFRSPTPHRLLFAPQDLRTADPTVAAGQTLVVTPAASDPDGDGLTWSAANLPAGAAFDPVHGVLTWATTPAQAGTYAGVTLRLWMMTIPPVVASLTGVDGQVAWDRTYLVITFLCWVPNLLVAELYLRSGRRRSRPDDVPTPIPSLHSGGVR